MIATVLRIGWINLKRDRVAQALTFVLPVVFFTIFAAVFGGQGSRSTPRVRLAVVDEDRSEMSRRLVAALEKEEGLRVVRAAKRKGSAPEASAPETPLAAAAAEDMVKRGDVPVALVLPAGLGQSFGSFSAEGPAIRLFSDASDPIAAQVVQGLLQKAALTGAPDALIKSGIGQFERYAGPLTPGQRKAVDAWLPTLGADGPVSPGSGGGPGPAVAGGLVKVEVVDVLRERGGAELISFYAAGTAVMFLLFSCAGAGGSLLDEVESGTLERVLGSKLGMGGLLAGKWLFLTLVGVLQVTVMFLWGMLLFRLPLLTHLPGFGVMTLFTAAAAAGFGLVLATASRTRAQLSGLSTIIILVMSALGGSMFPRFLMSESMQRVGLLTFNAWALDGYVKVFWRNAAVAELWPQVLVLLLLTVVFLAGARLLARRWETV